MYKTSVVEIWTQIGKVTTENKFNFAFAQAACGACLGGGRLDDSRAS
jgi:hypothetical protein